MNKNICTSCAVITALAGVLLVGIPLYQKIMRGAAVTLNTFYICIGVGLLFFTGSLWQLRSLHSGYGNEASGLTVPLIIIFGAVGFLVIGVSLSLKFLF